MDIHPSALIHPEARLANSVKVGPLVVIEADVEVGENSILETGTILYSGSRIGKNCKLGPYAIVGGTPMDSHYAGETSYAVLEDNVELREFVTVHKATGGGAETRIGEGSMIMTYTHITHNCRVGKGVTLVTSVQLGGHCEVGDYAFVGSTTIMHQFCRIGAYAVTGGGTASNQDILPFSMVYGMPAKHLRLNKVGLERRGFSKERYRYLEKAIRAFRRRDWALLEQLAQESEDVQKILDFKNSSQRGICGFV
ncbi:MAG: acyl-ACP--UDP-N-acetylglucosamine O-acyltransferase [Trueperaceae bacterium]|nr:acyl-ACP--UDP-N-acetylglucosamine O-acyltransferase [Trueperaceae bacterium]